MRNILYDGSYQGLRLPPEVQMQRLKKVIAHELTPNQRHVIIAYYFQQKTLPQIAQEQQVNKSTVCRTLHRAEARLRKYLRY